jgi:hypothetical protein
MAEPIKVLVGDAAVEAAEPAPPPKPPAPSLELEIRTTLDGNVAIYDHADLDIVVMPESKKVLALPKGEHTDEVYAAQDRLFHFLRGKGVITEDSIHGGNVYGSMQAKFPESSDGRNPVEVVVFSIGKFIQEEKPYYTHDAALEAGLQSRLLEPEQEEATELGEVPQEADKGSGTLYPAIKSYYRMFEGQAREED